MLILEYLHTQGIVHRDLKPENLLLNRKRHLKITDFGTASVYDFERLKDEEFKAKYKSIRDKFELASESNSLVGTAEYISPELIEDDSCCMESDLWALGCICYKIYSGKTPFYDQSEFLIFQNIKQGRFTSKLACDEVAKDFIMQLLQKRRQDRLGAGNDYERLKKHKFFDGLDFATLFESDGPQWHVVPKPKLDTILDPDLQFGQKKQFVNAKKNFIVFFGVVSLKLGWFN